MKTIFTVCLTFLLASTLWADDLTRAVQQRLKDQGFFYGNVDGQGGGETSAAIRRYQIRHGLQVTGQLNEETMRSIGIAPDRSQRSVDNPDDGDDLYSVPPPNGGSGRPQFNGNDYDDFPQRAPSRRGPVRANSYFALFARTPYEGAPRQLQENVLVAVQGELSKKGYFHSFMDGQPGAETSDAVIRFQSEAGLPVTGLLDMPTLNALRVLPGQRNGPQSQGEMVPRGSDGERIYRGIQVQ